MKLVSFEMDGYRRFADKQEVKFDGRIVALLGPNEAGKSTVLRALQALGNAEPLKTQGASQDVTRDKVLEGAHVVIKATFRLDESDLNSLKDIEGASRIRWMIVKKFVNGARIFQLQPPISRLGKKREQLIELVTQLLQSSSPKQNSDTDVQNHVADLAEAALRSIPDQEAESLHGDAIKALQALSGESRKRSALTAEQLALLEALIANEAKEHPSRGAEQILGRRLPHLVLFTDADRILATDYDLSTFFAPKNSVPIPQALKNLILTGGFTLDRLYNAAQSDKAKVETILNAANSKLREKISQAWKQSTLDIRLRLDGVVLTVLVASVGGNFENLSERSEGLRQFVALSAFLHQNELQNVDRDIILLIDEVEAHLHYDAQADLVQMLTKQELAKQVVYTTHSIGSFPEDLGAGVRIVRPVAGTHKSEVLNKIWLEDGVGLSPILSGMGAATMAFFPFRCCVMTEGATDMLLLPALLKELLGVAALDFYVLPGLAEIKGDHIPVMRNSGRRVAFVVDADDGGKGIRKKLKRSKIPKNNIVALTAADGTACVIEDFVDNSVYASAINAELGSSGLEPRITAQDISATMKPASVRAWCEREGINVPNKAAVAYGILERRHHGPLLDQRQVDALRALYRRLGNQLNLKMLDGH